MAESGHLDPLAALLMIMRTRILFSVYTDKPLETLKLGREQISHSSWVVSLKPRTSEVQSPHSVYKLNVRPQDLVSALYNFCFVSVRVLKLQISHTHTHTYTNMNSICLIHSLNVPFNVFTYIPEMND